MKKFIVLFTVLFIAGSANSQSLLELLSRMASGQSAATAEPVAQKIDAATLQSVWTYTGAAVEFTGTDVLSMLGSSLAAPQIKQSLTDYYARMGVVPGGCTLEFKDGGILVASTADHRIEGRYTLDEQAQKARASYNHPLLGGNRTLDGKLAYNGSRLTLTFEAAAIAAIIRELTAGMTIDQNVKDLIDMISQYPGLYLGLDLER